MGAALVMLMMATGSHAGLCAGAMIFCGNGGIDSRITNQW